MPPLAITALGTNLNDWTVGAFDDGGTTKYVTTSLTSALSAFSAYSYKDATSHLAAVIRIVLGGDNEDLQIGNTQRLSFFGRRTSPDRLHGAARVWGVRRLTRVGGSKCFMGQPLGELSIILGSSTGAVLASGGTMYNMVRDLKVVAPDRALTPPGMRVAAPDASGGLCSVLFDAMGFRQFVVELGIDSTKTTDMGTMACML